MSHSFKKAITMLVILRLFCISNAFSFPPWTARNKCSSVTSSSADAQQKSSRIRQHERKETKNTGLYGSVEEEEKEILDPEVAAKFKVVTCFSKSCNERRKRFGLDPLATFVEMYSRAQESAPCVVVEEGPCLGSCRNGPVVAIQHDDFIGHVSIEGMTESEFSERV